MNDPNWYAKLLMLILLICLSSCQTSYERINEKKQKPRILILTDINNAGGDPDDKQSWIHVLWYADALDIVGMVPDRWNGQGFEATMEGLAEYEKDYHAYQFQEKGYPTPKEIQGRVALNDSIAVEMIIREALESRDEPLYVLVWGSMITLRNALFKAPDIASKLRVLTIGTGRKYGPKDEVPGEDCDVVNWNGKGRNDIYEDQRFNEMWWLESNWTYNGMFMGDRPTEMFHALTQYGAMGAHIKNVVKHHPWAQYFRVGDTPTVLYLIDHDHDIDDPSQPSWAGKFYKPFPQKRPNYFTDDAGEIKWDYAEPCNTWNNLEEMYAYNKSTLLSQREDMYQALLSKLNELYNK